MPKPAGRAGTKDSRDAHNASLPALQGAARRKGRQGRVLRVRDFGSVASQALKKLHRPWCGEQQAFSPTA